MKVNPSGHLTRHSYSRVVFRLKMVAFFKVMDAQQNVPKMKKTKREFLLSDNFLK